MKSLLAAAALLIPLVAACGAGSSGHDSAADVAKSAGCDSPSTISPGDQELFVTNSVSCTFNGHDVTIGWFDSSDSMKNYRKVADQFGGGGIAYGKDFMVECSDDQADCDAVVKAAKG